MSRCNGGVQIMWASKCGPCANRSLEDKGPLDRCALKMKKLDESKTIKHMVHTCFFGTDEISDENWKLDHI